MAKDPDVIKKYTLKMTYICPVTGKEVVLNNEGFDLEGSEGMVMGYYDVSISIGKCKSCGRYHDAFKLY